MADAWNGLRNEWLQLSSSLEHKLDEAIPSLRGEERRTALRRVNNELDEADEILDQMELEAKGKAKLMVQVRAFRQQLKQNKAKVSTLSAQSDRDLLLSSSSNPSGSGSYGLNVTDADLSDSEDAVSSRQRQRLLQSTGTLNTSSGRLDNATRLAAENEEIGQNVLSSLVGQRMQLQHANEQLDEADVSVGRAGQTINKMIRLAGRQKLVLWLFGIVLAALILFILYRKFLH
ncbi:hypothetical protein JCM8097_002725 [Rhodosporidiobolus ruineniae]